MLPPEVIIMASQPKTINFFAFWLCILEITISTILCIFTGSKIVRFLYLVFSLLP